MASSVSSGIRKVSPSVPTPPEILARLAESCDALVQGVAD
jgi:hypothetical protein